MGCHQKQGNTGRLLDVYIWCLKSNTKSLLLCALLSTTAKFPRGITRVIISPIPYPLSNTREHHLTRHTHAHHPNPLSLNIYFSCVYVLFQFSDCTREPNAPLRRPEEPGACKKRPRGGSSGLPTMVLRTAADASACTWPSDARVLYNPEYGAPVAPPAATAASGTCDRRRCHEKLYGWYGRVAAAASTITNAAVVPQSRGER